MSGIPIVTVSDHTGNLSKLESVDESADKFEYFCERINEWEFLDHEQITLSLLRYHKLKLFSENDKLQLHVVKALLWLEHRLDKTSKNDGLVVSILHKLMITCEEPELRCLLLLYLGTLKPQDKKNQMNYLLEVTIIKDMLEQCLIEKPENYLIIITYLSIASSIYSYEDEFWTIIQDSVLVEDILAILNEFMRSKSNVWQLCLTINLCYTFLQVSKKLCYFTVHYWLNIITLLINTYPFITESATKADANLVSTAQNICAKLLEYLPQIKYDELSSKYFGLLPST